MMLSDLQTSAFNALCAYARNPVVFLMDGPIGPDSTSAAIGSGTLVESAGGSTVVLTAKHNFDPMPEGGISVGGNRAGGISNAVRTVLRHPNDDVDVALAILSPEASAAFSSLAVPANCVSLKDDVQFEDENPMILCGYPSGYRRTLVDESAGKATVEFASVSYLARVKPSLDDKGRYQVTWKEAIMTEHDAVWPPIPRGEEFTMVHPVGISGGPLWRFRKLDPAAVWAPAKMGTIVGIASGYRKDLGIEYCPSVSVWGEWFLQELAEIDRTPRT
jgi:hypothetical protein